MIKEVEGNDPNEIAKCMVNKVANSTFKHLHLRCQKVLNQKRSMNDWTKAFATFNFGVLLYHYKRKPKVQDVRVLLSNYAVCYTPRFF